MLESAITRILILTTSAKVLAFPEEGQGEGVTDFKLHELIFFSYFFKQYVSLFLMVGLGNQIHLSESD